MVEHIVAGDKLILHAAPAVSQIAPLFKGGAEPFEFEGQPFLKVPYAPENCGLIFDQLGTYIKGPAHDWPRFGGRFEPRPEQRVTVDLMTQCPRFYCFNGLATGKTASAIWAAEYMRETRGFKRVLIVSTITTLRPVWDRELSNICPHRSRVIVRGSKDKRAELIAEGYDYTIINHDGVKSSFDALMKEPYDLIIIDEASVYRTDTTDRSRQTRKLCEGRWLWAMTATPRPKSSMDAWGLGRLVNPKRLPKSKIAFQAATMMQVSDFTWIDRPNALSIVFDALRPAIRIRTEDCVSLPPTIYLDRDVPLSPEQEKARTTLIKDFVYDVQKTPGKVVSPVNAADIRNKVLQVAQGTVRIDEKTHDELPFKPSLDETVRLIQQADGKAIVFATFRATVHRLKRELEKEFGPGSVALAIGGQSGGTRDAEIDRFEKNPACRVLVAHPKTASHGLNLIIANLVVWFGITPDAEQYEQANARMRRPGQTRTTVVAHLLRCDEDRKSLAVCQRRTDEQETLLDMVADYTNGRY